MPIIPAPTRQEIDHRTIKLIVGIVALSLAPLTSFFASTRIASISASYHEAGWSQSIFIGFLFAIGALLLAFNGQSKTEMLLSKTAAIAGLGVALFPCKCETDIDRIPHLHGIFATMMFLILAFFCYEFFKRARAKKHTEATARAGIYAVCGVAILASILVLAMDKFSGGSVQEILPRLTFYGEAAALLAFGVSWLTASKVLPGLTREDERFSPLKATNPSKD
jgi:predicted transporter